MSLLREVTARSKLLALCHAAVSDPWYLEGRFRELIACATRHPEKKPPAVSRGLLLVQQGAAYRLTWRLAPPLAALAWLPRMSPLETSLTQSEPLSL